jgi:ubiquinone/menaquinone biosynthesis C-methylase UbiE
MPTNLKLNNKIYMDKKSMQLFFEKVAPQRQKWRSKNSTYHKQLQRYFSFFVSENSSIMEIGCSTGELLASLRPAHGVGIDFSSKAIEIARSNFPHLKFICQDAEQVIIIDESGLKT